MKRETYRQKPLNLPRSLFFATQPHGETDEGTSGHSLARLRFPRSETILLL